VSVVQGARAWSELFAERTRGHTVYGDYARRKPFMVGETGTVEDAARPGRKGRWFVNAARALRTRFPRVRAFVYFNTIADERDWRMETSPSSVRGFTRLAQDAGFRRP